MIFCDLMMIWQTHDRILYGKIAWGPRRTNQETTKLGLLSVTNKCISCLRFLWRSTYHLVCFRIYSDRLGGRKPFGDRRWRNRKKGPFSYAVNDWISRHTNFKYSFRVSNQLVPRTVRCFKHSPTVSLGFVNYTRRPGCTYFTGEKTRGIAYSGAQ